MKTNAEFQALPLVEPYAHGRSCAPNSRVPVNHASATTTYTTAASASCTTRRRRAPGSPSQASSASPGSATTDSSSFTSKAIPSAAAAPSSQTVRPLRAARTSSASASTVSAIITASIVSLRAVITSIGSTASASAEASPARTPNTGLTAAYSSGTASVPASASGVFSAAEPKPSSLTLATCSHRSTGGLSIAIAPEGSTAPKKKLCQESPMLRTAPS